jgi:pimeloyl-ACP methyl ester carboxylesterase
MGRRASLTFTGIATAALVMISIASNAFADRGTDSVVIRGRTQYLHVYGTRGSGEPVIVSSGDGGWLHLAPHVAEALAARGFFVVGFDCKAYLEGFSSKAETLRAEEVPADYRVLIDYAAAGGAAKPILIGVSEGAGLSVLAASDQQNKQAIRGVVGLGLPDMNELGWHWRDSVIYLTHGLPKEPMFSSAAIVGRVAPLPIAAIHSTTDEFVPLAEVQRTLDKASEPKRLWVVTAADHRFSDNLAEFDRCLLQALTWVQQSQPR